ncbi:H-NS family nucleoid-associated regulatory protein [Aeromonas jandaei]|uniref:H-NS family histone-like protein n=1 Tax=Aeromonas jandaei TaxID=650 RepID=UPI003BA2ABDE
MNWFLQVLLNIRSLRQALDGLSLEQIIEAHGKIETIYLERLEQSEKIQADQAKHRNKLAEFHALLAEAGIDPAELVSSALTSPPPQRSKRSPRPPKYRFIDQGVEKTWTGQGRTPNALKTQLSQGRQLDEFLI